MIDLCKKNGKLFICGFNLRRFYYVKTMEEKKIELTYEVYKTEELSVEDAYLRGIAIEAAQFAYAPYSNFKVGAAVLLEGGRFVKGNNQENAA